MKTKQRTLNYIRDWFLIDGSAVASCEVGDRGYVNALKRQCVRIELRRDLIAARTSHISTAAVMWELVSAPEESCPEGDMIVKMLSTLPASVREYIRSSGGW